MLKFGNEIAVVASPHPERGEIVKAFIILSAEYSSLSPSAQSSLVTELQTFCRKEASPYKYPREIEFVKELPKTVSGKIRRVELRDMEYEVSSFSFFLSLSLNPFGGKGSNASE